MDRPRFLILTCLLALASTAAPQEPLLQIVGEPYFGGEITVHLTAPDQVGNPAALAYGLDPLPRPVATGKGPWHIGQLFKILQLGAVPPTGRIDLPLTMPPETPGVEGLPIIVQGYVAPRLSNPAELRLDLPYLVGGEAVEVLPPLPVNGANFGDRVDAGDFDGDGLTDLIVGAAFESYSGVIISGSAYVLWGPDWVDFSVLRPPTPEPINAFGEGLAVADFDMDGYDDIAIAEVATDPPQAGEHGNVYVAHGTPDRDLDLSLVGTSPGTGAEGISFGRNLVAGDVTGDAIPDIVVGADATAVSGTLFSGAVLILPGPAFDSPWIIPNPTPVGADFFGAMVRLHDVNGDSYLDIVEGSDRADVLDLETQLPIINAGEIHIGYGPDFSSWTAIHNPLGPTTENRFGNAVAPIDIDFDGFAEIATTDAQGQGFIVSASGVLVQHVPKPPSLVPNPFGETAFGESAVVFDINRDGTEDLIFGDPFDGTLGGCAFGDSGTLWAAIAPYYSTFGVPAPPGAGCGDEFAWSLACRDVNGDDVVDLLVGVPLANSLGLSNSGKVVVYPGE